MRNERDKEGEEGEKHLTIHTDKKPKERSCQTLHSTTIVQTDNRSWTRLFSTVIND